MVKNNLPHAFEHLYWNMADTSYKEEVVKAIMEEYKLDVESSKWFLRRCGLFKKDSPILYYWLDGHIQESMGAFHGVTDIGNRFIDDWILGRVKKSYK